MANYRRSVVRANEVLFALAFHRLLELRQFCVVQGFRDPRQVNGLPSGKVL